MSETVRDGTRFAVVWRAAGAMIRVRASLALRLLFRLLLLFCERREVSQRREPLPRRKTVRERVG